LPYCSHCGNDKSFASSIFPPASETANAPSYGLLASFNEDETIKNMECQGADLDDAQAAFEEPVRYFNTCPVCGSDNIKWNYKQDFH